MARTTRDRPPRRYQDFVIRDGKFIGAFEKMYRTCEDPWDQDKDEKYYPTREIALLLLKQIQCRAILDIGCGTGRFTTNLRAATAAEVTALDVSDSALGIARRRDPKIAFRQAEVPPIPFEEGSFDTVIASELLWYIVPHLESFFSEVERVLRPDGWLLVIQQFYRRGRQQYQRGVMTTPSQLMKMLPFDVKQAVSAYNTESMDYHSILLCRKRAGKESHVEADGPGR